MNHKVPSGNRFSGCSLDCNFTRCLWNVRAILPKPNLNICSRSSCFTQLCRELNIVDTWVSDCNFGWMSVDVILNGDSIRNVSAIQMKFNRSSCRTCLRRGVLKGPLLAFRTIGSRETSGSGGTRHSRGTCGSCHSSRSSHRTRSTRGSCVSGGSCRSSRSSNCTCSSRRTRGTSHLW